MSDTSRSSGTVLLRGVIEALLEGNSIYSETDEILATEVSLHHALLNFPDPRQLVYACGFRTCPARELTACQSTDRTVNYSWAEDERERGLRIFHGLAHAMLLRARMPVTERHAWSLTKELVVPRAWIRAGSSAEDLSMVQRHAPPWFLSKLS